MRIPARIACALASVATFSAAEAHHASNLDYDADNVGTVTGVVADVFWANPHVHVYLTVTNEDGTTSTWDMEGPNLASLSRRGVSRDMIRVGDRLEITGTLGRNGMRRIWAQAIVKADGTVVMGATN